MSVVSEHKVATKEDQEAVEVLDLREILDLRVESLRARYRRLKQLLEANGILPFLDHVELEYLEYLFRNVEKYRAWVSYLFHNVDAGRSDKLGDPNRDYAKSYRPDGTPHDHNIYWNKYRYWNERFEVEGWKGISDEKLFWEEIGKKKLADPVWWQLQDSAQRRYEAWQIWKKEINKKKQQRHRDREKKDKQLEGTYREPGRPDGSKDSGPRTRRFQSISEEERRLEEKMLEESEEPETPGIREYCDVCDKFADLKNGYNYYTDESVRICEECLTHNARFRGGKRGQEEDEGETDLGLSL